MEDNTMTPKRKTETDLSPHATGSANEPGSTHEVPYTAIFPPTHPGESLLEYLQEQNVDTAGCAELCGLPLGTLENLIGGYIPVDGHIATALKRGGFGPSADYWLGLEWIYQSALELHGKSRPKRPHRNTTGAQPEPAWA